uniref:LRAT domain-containing protein n=1 Tax=Pundamilia nyererei TaxID=303518 RepID=A0A3B4FJZ5_9CICH
MYVPAHSWCFVCVFFPPPFLTVSSPLLYFSFSLSFILSPCPVPQEPELGDLIEISRDNYKHWAVYVGAGFVVHFVNHCKFHGAAVQAANGIVRKEKMWDVVGKDKWKINNSMDRQYEPRPANAIVEDAKALVGKELRYDLVSFNCEHFVTKLRYGVAESPQVVTKTKKYTVTQDLRTHIRTNWPYVWAAALLFMATQTAVLLA